jgi:hypothetical protein
MVARRPKNGHDPTTMGYYKNDDGASVILKGVMRLRREVIASLGSYVACATKLSLRLEVNRKLKGR